MIISILPLLLLLQLACSLGIDSEAVTDFSNHKLDSLCDIGCKCPEEEQAMEFLDCSRLGINKLPDMLQFPSSVTKISFRANRITSLPVSTFSRTDSIEEMDLSLNKIARIDNFTFTPFSSLTQLQLSHNMLSEVDSELLQGLSNLLVLELGHNKIQKLSSTSFRNIPNIQELRLQYNPIFELPEQLLQFLPRLQKLDLQETGLVKLPSNIFLSTPRLQWLSLSNNAFETVPQSALSKAPLLERLDLSGNDFRILVEGAFQGMPNITILFLNSLPRLLSIEKNSLAGLDKLKIFGCSYNPKLKFIHEDAFGTANSTAFGRKTPPREQLHLRQNALRTLQAPLEKESLPSLSFVDLTDNPWHCDCNLDWMAFLREEHQKNVICQSPAYLKGRSFDTIALAELKCEDKLNNLVFITVISSMVAFAVVMIGLSAVVFSRSRVGLFVRAKKQFSYAKVIPGTETVDLEWDPSAET
ncbi:leucine-rich repeat-containing protein 15-like [Uloborus diversus]|uniref:leucine-rich repeat-containing protein 15-like n=1 Tax=Uloborus diversus TaxID=327109 RepID=UPI00240A0DE3|nr:leucine-rich repeat-containing protein 15-like [Uloborus diversus]